MFNLEPYEPGNPAPQAEDFAPHVVFPPAPEGFPPSASPVLGQPAVLHGQLLGPLDVPSLLSFGSLLFRKLETLGLSRWLHRKLPVMLDEG